MMNETISKAVLIVSFLSFLLYFLNDQNFIQSSKLYTVLYISVSGYNGLNSNLPIQSSP